MCLCYEGYHTISNMIICIYFKDRKSEILTISRGRVGTQNKGSDGGRVGHGMGVDLNY